MKPIARASGRSAVASAAYRAAERLENERDGLVHDFSRRSGVEHAEIVLPAGADAAWAKERSALWNAAEASEKRKDARVAREIEIALPHELSAEQRLELKKIVEPLIGGPGFTGHAPGGPSRWSTKRSSEWQPLKPKLVAEVRYDHFSGGRFRHGTKFLRWRPEKKPQDCTFDQLEQVP